MRRRRTGVQREIVGGDALLRANTSRMGHSGCRPLLVDRLLAFLDPGSTVVPETGERGESGDLEPLAHWPWLVDRERPGRASMARSLP